MKPKHKKHIWHGQLTGCHRRFLAFLQQHGPAALDLLGEAAEKDVRPRTEPGPIQNRVVYPPPARVGAAVSIWLREWGFIAKWDQDGHEYWKITEEGAAALALMESEE